MSSFKRYGAVLTVLLILPRCMAPRPNFDAVRSIEDQPQVRASHPPEWRTARRMPACQNQAYDLGLIPKDGVLRLGVRDQGMSGAKVSMRLYAGATLVSAFESAGEDEWRDHRIDLSRFSGNGKRASLVCDSPWPFWLGPHELFTPDNSQPNVLVYLIDALRQDHLGCYGYTRDTSPHIDAFADDAVQFAELTPQSSWTRPSVASLFTSTYPNIHQAQDHPDVLRQGLPSLAETLSEAGCETLGFMSNPNCLPLWGFGDDFNRYVDVDSTRLETLDDANVVNAALAAIECAKGRPWYVYAHAMAPHAPYSPPPPYDVKFEPSPEAPDLERSMALYDGEIAYADAQFGRLLDGLKDLGLYEDTLIVLLSDHGEQFMEHGERYHGNSLFEEELRVPLLMKLPGNDHGGETRKGIIEMIDIAPTILDVLKETIPSGFQGRSFSTTLEGQDEGRLAAYASLQLEARSLCAAKNDAWKYIHDLARNQEGWYDLHNDPTELRPQTGPSPNSAFLAAYASERASMGMRGFHLLVTGGKEERHVVTGHIQAEGIKSFGLQAGAGHASREDHAVVFRITTEDARDRLPSASAWFDRLEQYSARLHLEVDPETELTLNINVDGAPAPAEVVFFRHDNPPRSVDAMTVAARNLRADPTTFDPAGLPARFAIYAWYVAGPETRSSADLDPQTTDALRALGYLR